MARPSPLLLVPPAAAALLVVVLAGLGRASRTRPPSSGLADGRLRPCPAAPACVASEGQAPAVAPLALGGDLDAAFDALVALAHAAPRTELVEHRPGYAHLVGRSAVFGFADDVELRLDREAGVAHVRSAARVGRSDLGANRRRVEALRAAWDAVGGRTEP